jgi:hypothetical protein
VVRQPEDEFSTHLGDLQIGFFIAHSTGNTVLGEDVLEKLSARRRSCC